MTANLILPQWHETMWVSEDWATFKFSHPTAREGKAIGNRWFPKRQRSGGSPMVADLYAFYRACEGALVHRAMLKGQEVVPWPP